jgi:hypothetical protein
MDTLRDIMLQRLQRMGLPTEAVPGFMRNLRQLMADKRHLGLHQINQRLQWLGWTDIELDEYTLQLIMADEDRYFQ